MPCSSKFFLFYFHFKCFKIKGFLYTLAFFARFLLLYFYSDLQINSDIVLISYIASISTQILLTSRIMTLKPYVEGNIFAPNSVISLIQNPKNLEILFVYDYIYMYVILSKYKKLIIQTCLQ